MTERLHDRYALIRPLGAGGAANTWLATDTQTGRAVTVKRLSNPIDPLSRNINRETAVLGQLRHPQIPAFVDAFVETWRMQGYLHVVLEYVDGEPLSEVLARRRFDQDKAREIVDDLLGVVAWLHRLAPPVIHRDIKPSNIILRSDGRVVLIDFGLATDAVDRTFQHTMAAGTLGFQAPEQIAGDPRPASDVYSVGVLALQLLTRAKPRELLSGQQLRWRERAAHLSPRWRTWLERALAPDPTQRFADGHTARSALHAHPPAQPPPEPRHAIEKRSVRLPPAITALSGGVILLALTVAGGFLVSNRDEPGPIQGATRSVPAPPATPTPSATPTPPVAPVSPIESGRAISMDAANCRAGDMAACLEAARALERPDSTGEVPAENQRLRQDLLGLACMRAGPFSEEACAMLEP